MSPPFDRDFDRPQSAGLGRRGVSKDDLRAQMAEAAKNTENLGKRKNEDRRFTDKPLVDPGSVRSLPLNHPAMKENRTLFPSTVVEIDTDFSDRLLISGKNNRKLGERVAKGRFKNYALYSLSLEERATCPVDCGVRGYCYGNGMQMARRHRIGDPAVFFGFLESEIDELLATHRDGLLVRLHVLGDFPDVKYVEFWSRMLKEHAKLACYGYTHRRAGKRGDEIGNAIDKVKRKYPDRFRIRWSNDALQPSRDVEPDSAVVINRIPEGSRVPEGLVCPAQTEDTACCATCGLCWEGHARKDAIVFIKHGPKSLEAAAATAKMQPAPIPKTPGKAVAVVAETPAPDKQGYRRIRGIIVAQKREPIIGRVPKVRLVKPTDIFVEVAYQRDLSGKSIKLIRKIVIHWDWSKYKCPICVDTQFGLVCIDGQHTAIGAASRPDEIPVIPVMVVDAATVAARAGSFVAHNRDRLIMTPAQIFHGDVAAQVVDAKTLLDIVMRAGGSVPRLPVQRNYAKPGEITAIADLRKRLPSLGPEMTERIVRIAVLSRAAPISLVVVRGLVTLLTEKRFAAVAKYPDARIAKALGAIENLDAVSQHYAAETGQSRFRTCALLIAQGLGEKIEAEVA